MLEKMKDKTAKEQGILKLPRSDEESESDEEKEKKWTEKSKQLRRNFKRSKARL